VIRLVIASLADAIIVEDVDAVIVILQDDVDNARNCVRAIGSTASIVQDFDPVDRCQRE
jgi:hypothetical protein